MMVKELAANTVNKWNRSDFVPVQCPLPAGWIKGKDTITTRFVPHAGHATGGIFDLWIVRTEEGF